MFKVEKFRFLKYKYLKYYNITYLIKKYLFIVGTPTVNCKLNIKMIVNII